MVAWVLDVVRALKPARTATVVGYQADRVREALGQAGGRYVLQREQLGTGHAVLQASRAIGSGAGTLLVLNGDMPTLRAATLRKLLAGHRKSGAALTILTVEMDDASGYGRVIRDSHGRVERIVEQRDASAAERRVREANMGMYAADAGKLLRVLRRIPPRTPPVRGRMRPKAAACPPVGAPRTAKRSRVGSPGADSSRAPAVTWPKASSFWSRSVSPCASASS